MIEAKDRQAASENLGKLTDLLRNAGATGFRQIPGGFSISDPQDLGRQPVEVVLKGDRIVIGYGQKATEEALSGGSGQTLDSNSAFDGRRQGARRDRPRRVRRHPQRAEAGGVDEQVHGTS